MTVELTPAEILYAYDEIMTALFTYENIRKTDAKQAEEIAFKHRAGTLLVMSEKLQAVMQENKAVFDKLFG